MVGLPQKSTLTAACYVETVLPGVIKSVRQQRPTVGISTTFPLHDNAGPHKAKVTVTLLKEKYIQVPAHPPYSLDLAACDDWSLKKSWQGEGGDFPAFRTSQKQ